MIVLDTNVVSVMMQPNTGPQVLYWLNKQPAEMVWTTSITVYEIEFGLKIMARGKRRTLLTDHFQRLMEKGLNHRVLVFDNSAAKASAQLAAALRKQGQMVDVRDIQIAGIVLSRRATLATRNVKHFENTGVVLMNPWEIK